jgi:hypothetical protein
MAMLKPAHATYTFLIDVYTRTEQLVNGRRDSLYSVAYFDVRYCMSNINTAPTVF